jgi:hypothetical protein
MRSAARWAAPGLRPARSVGLRPHSHASLHPHLGGRSCYASPHMPAQTSHTAKRYAQRGEGKTYLLDNNISEAELYSV